MPAIRARRKILARSAQASLLSAALCSSALAVDRTWDGFTDNSFVNNTNWTTAAAPGSTDNARFMNQAGIKRSLVLFGTDRSVASLSIDGTPSTGAYEFQQPTSNTSVLTVDTLRIGNQNIGLTPVTFNGFRTSDRIFNITGGTLSMTNGAQVVASQIFRLDKFFGAAAVNVGTASISTPDLELLGASTMNINFGGSVLADGLLLMQDAAQLNVNDGGSLQITDASLIQAGTLTLNAGGTINLGAASLTTTGPARIRFNTNYTLPDSKTLSITQGGSVSAFGFVYIGGVGTGTMVVSGSGSSVNIGESTSLQSSWGRMGHAATITFSSSGTGEFNRGLVIAGDGSFSTARVNLNTGASLTVDNFLATGGPNNTASITINGATLTSTGTSLFQNGTTIALQSGGVLGFNGDATFSTGATLNWTGGTISIASGKSLNVSGGTINNTSGGIGLNNAALNVTNNGGAGGQFLNDNSFNLAGAGTFSMLVDGAASRVTAGGGTASEWAKSTGSTATVTFSNSGAGTYSGLKISTNGGTTRLTLDSGGILNVASLETGNATLSSIASITINNFSKLNCIGTASFFAGTTVDLSMIAGAMALGGNTTFSTGATLKQTNGTFTLPPGGTLAFDGGVGTIIPASLANTTLRISSGGALTMPNPALFESGGKVSLQSGSLAFGDDTTFSTGSTFSWSGGTWSLTGRKTLAFDGGAGSFAASGFELSEFSTLRVTGGGTVTSDSWLDIGNGAPGTMIVQNPSSKITSNNIVNYSAWGKGAAGTATITFADFGAGSYNGGLRIGDAGGTATVNIQSSAQLNTASLLAGPSAVQINVSGGSLSVLGNATLNNGVTVNYSAGSLGVNGLLDMHGNSQINFTPGRDKILTIGQFGSPGNLSLLDNSKIDLSDNRLVIVGGSLLNTIGYLKRGRNGGSWNGNGLASSAAADPFTFGQTALGYSPGNLFGASIIVVKYAYLGDANLDGTVNALDFNALASNFGAGGLNPGFWFTGDFNYDGTVNTSDFTALASNFNRSLTFSAPPVDAPVALDAIVPEPLAILPALAAVYLSCQRRGRRLLTRP